jgi:hypothetical protein
LKRIGEIMIVYHYCSIENMFKILKENELWLFNNNTMNDYSEGHWIENIFNKYIRENNLENDTIINSLFQQYKINNVPFYFISFSANKDSLSQWKGYSKDATGVCIGFDIDETEIPIVPPLPNGNPKLSLGWTKIEYDRDYQEKTVFDLLNSLREMQTTQNIDALYIEYATILRRCSMFFKNHGFYEESEWRLISTPIIAEKEKELVLLGNCSPIEFLVANDTIRSYFRYSFLKKVVKEIIIGPKCKLNQFEFENFLMTNKYKDTTLNVSEITYK